MPPISSSRLSFYSNISVILMTAPMYSLYAKDYEKAILDNVYNALLERPSLLSMLPDVKSKTVLDLGCGPGIYAEHLIQQGADVTACDISEEMVEIVRNKFAETVPCYVQDLNDGLPKEADNQYDVVICPLTLHYIENLHHFFSEVSRTLKDGGVFFFSTHHPMVDFQSSPSGNYFSCELVTEEWDTLGHPVQVQFYRRSLTDLFSAISGAGLNVCTLNEGMPSEEMKQQYPDAYKHLSKNPNFIFFECKKSP